MDLGALFGGGGSIDFFSLLNRAFEQMAHELARHENVPGLGQQPPEELLATAVGKRLAGMIVADRSPLGLAAGNAANAGNGGNGGWGSPDDTGDDPEYDEYDRYEGYDEDTAGDTATAGHEAGGVVTAFDAAGRSLTAGRDEELAERDQVLAAALGACDCWGQNPRCRICQGEGGPGWLLPDRQLFTAYVYPALRTVRAAAAPRTARASATNRRNHNGEPKENGYVHPR